MSKFKLFALSFTATLCLVLALFYINRPRNPRFPRLKPVAATVFVTSQLSAENVLALERRGYQNIVDLRPDGEASDQAPSSEIKQAAEQSGMTFYYIPVPHGDIPPTAVDALQQALADHGKRTVLYCRSGNRAVRTFALAEASRADGPGCDDLIAMVRDAGFSGEDLRENINERIARRNPTEEAKR